MAGDKFIESSYEKALIALFQELGYTYECGYDVERDYREPFYREVLEASLKRLNKGVSADILAEGLKMVTNLNEGALIQDNRCFTEMLQNGFAVPYLENGENRTATLRLVDFEQPLANDFRIVNQWSVEELGKIRCDMVVMINGLPLVVVELKTASDENVTIEDAYLQIRNYMKKCPSLFGYNAFCVISDLAQSKAGTITSKFERFMEWKSEDGNYETKLIADYATFFKGMFMRERLIDILKNYICFDLNDGAQSKILTAYHQYFAVEKAVARTHQAVDGDGKIGVFWHTQGSGKSFSMIFFAHQLIQEFAECTLVVVTDRKDLDNQLYGQFCRCQDFLRQV
ncbi:MAG: type I restriction endonuclease, partial [Bacteroidales bacterium]|nr:type I restriction endonuclease [Bacteroidales bacterium]